MRPALDLASLGVQVEEKFGSLPAPAAINNSLFKERTGAGLIF